MNRFQKWEPSVGHQLQAVRYIRERLRTRREGKFTQEEGASEQVWEEPEASDVEMEVWSQIRDGFSGKNVKTRDLKRLWSRRNTLAKEVELIELGSAGGVFKACKRSSGALRWACRGAGQRGMLPVSRPAEGGEEGGQGGEEGGQDGGKMGGQATGRTEKVVRKGRTRALLPILDAIQKDFEKCRMGGQYVDSEDLYKPAVSSKAKSTLGVSRGLSNKTAFRGNLRI